MRSLRALGRLPNPALLVLPVVAALASCLAGCACVDEGVADRAGAPATRPARDPDRSKHEGNGRVGTRSRRDAVDAGAGRSDAVPAGAVDHDATASGWNAEEHLPEVVAGAESVDARRSSEAVDQDTSTPLPPDELAERIRADEALKRLRGEEVFGMTVGWPEER